MDNLVARISALECENVSKTSNNEDRENENQMELSPEVEDEPEKFMCSKCEFMCDNDTALRNHNKNVHNEHHGDQKLDDGSLIDGSWLCKECSFQTNKETNLRKHMENSHKFICSICDKTFTFKTPFMLHKRNEHDQSVDLCKDYLNNKCPYEKAECWYHHREKEKPKTQSNIPEPNSNATVKSSNSTTKFKPCKFLPNCPYGEKCFYNHDPVPSGVFLCYECGFQVKSVEDLMSHRKKEHQAKMCQKFLDNSCRYNEHSCWFSHKKQTSQNNVDFQPLVNQDPPDLENKMTHILQEMTSLLSLMSRPTNQI